MCLQTLVLKSLAATPKRPTMRFVAFRLRGSAECASTAEPTAADLNYSQFPMMSSSWLVFGVIAEPGRRTDSPGTINAR